MTQGWARYRINLHLYQDQECITIRVKGPNANRALLTDKSCQSQSKKGPSRGVKHIYFVAETKGTMSSMQLRPDEKTKIECARKFFAEISQAALPNNVRYDVVDSYSKLMDLVAKPLQDGLIIKL